MIVSSSGLVCCICCLVVRLVWGSILLFADKAITRSLQISVGVSIKGLLLGDLVVKVLACSTEAHGFSAWLGKNVFDFLGRIHWRCRLDVKFD